MQVRNNKSQSHTKSFSLHMVNCKSNKSCKVKFIIDISKNPDPPPPLEKLTTTFPSSSHSKKFPKTSPFYKILKIRLHPTLGGIKTMLLLLIAFIRTNSFITTALKTCPGVASKTYKILDARQHVLQELILIVHYNHTNLISHT